MSEGPFCIFPDLKEQRYSLECPKPQRWNGEPSWPRLYQLPQPSLLPSDEEELMGVSQSQRASLNNTALCSTAARVASRRTPWMEHSNSRHLACFLTTVTRKFFLTSDFNSSCYDICIPPQNVWKCPFPQIRHLPSRAGQEHPLTIFSSACHCFSLGPDIQGHCILKVPKTLGP